MPDPGGCTLSRLDLLLTTLSGNNLSIVELKEALATEDKDAIQAKTNSLTEAAEKLAEQAYAENAEAGESAEEGKAKAEADDVVDAEFEEVNDDKK